MKSLILHICRHENGYPQGIRFLSASWYLGRLWQTPLMSDSRTHNLTFSQIIITAIYMLFPLAVLVTTFPQPKYRGTLRFTAKSKLCTPCSVFFGLLRRISHLLRSVMFCFWLLIRCGGELVRSPQLVVLLCHEDELVFSSWLLKLVHLGSKSPLISPTSDIVGLLKI